MQYKVSELQAFAMLQEEVDGYEVRIEFLKQTIENYKTLPLDLLGTYDVAQCRGGCDVLRKNFWDVWNTNTGLNAKFEKVMERYKDLIKSKDDRIMEMEGLVTLLERSLSQANAQLAEKRRREGVQCPSDLGDVEEYFWQKLDEKDGVLEVMRNRVADLEAEFFLKEQESASRQLQINHLLSLPNQLEHASEVNSMRNKLREAEKQIKELQRIEPVCVPLMRVVQVVELAGDKILWGRFNDFFRRMDRDGATSGSNQEDYLYDQFLLDQPHQEQNKLRPDTYTRDELLEAMHRMCGDIKTKKRKLEGCTSRRDFAVCLASIGGRCKCRKGARYWVNVEMTRRPYFTWDV